MKKFVILTTTLLLILFTFYYSYYYYGFYFQFQTSNTINNDIFIQDKNIIVENKLYTIKSISLNNTNPDNQDISKQTYLNYFKLISQCNINTIRLYTILNKEFYDALNTYNASNTKPLYIIQGITFNNTQEKEMIQHIKQTIDVIHGNRALSSKGMYLHDISPYVLAYTIECDFTNEYINYTNLKYKDQTSYQGTYFYTSNASPFEILIARLSNTLIEYETNRYAMQRPIFYSTNFIHDPFVYSPLTSLYLNKFTYIDFNHIVPTDKNLSKTSIIYTCNPLEFKNLELETKAQTLDTKFKQDNGYMLCLYRLNQRTYPSINNYINTNQTSWKDYLNILNHYYKMPILVEFGIPSLALLDNQTVIDENKQATLYKQYLKDIQDINLTGTIIHHFQDDYNRSSWNMYDDFYCNSISTNQNYGLLTFQTSKKEYTTLIKNKNHSLQVSYDDKFIYFKIYKPHLNLNTDTFYIPIDITPQSGSRQYKDTKLKFNRDIDFLITINQTNSQIEVQEYYNKLRALKGEELYGINSYSHQNVPSKYTNKFNDIDIMIQNKASNYQENLQDGNLTYPIGHLINSKDSHLASYYTSHDHLYIKIPYYLLNFNDLYKLEIDDDYYRNYGIEKKRIHNIYIGLSSSYKYTQLKQYKLKSTNYKYKPRLKKAYSTIQTMWEE